MNNKNLLSESAVWKTTAEFNSGLSISCVKGEIDIDIKDDGTIEMRSCIDPDGKKINSCCTIRKITEKRYEYRSENFETGIQKGFFDVSGNRLFSKFRAEKSGMNGYEIITREDNVCRAAGALYNGDILIKSWDAVMYKDTIPYNG